MYYFQSSTQDQFPNVLALVDKKKLDTERNMKYDATILYLLEKLKDLHKDFDYVYKVAHDRHLMITKLFDKTKSLYEELEAQHSTIMNLRKALKKKRLTN